MALDIGKNPFGFYVTALSTGIFSYSYIPLVSWKIYVFLLVLVLAISALIVKKLKFRIVFSLLILFCWFLIGLIAVNLNNAIPKDHYTHFIENNSHQVIRVQIEKQNNSNDTNRKYVAELRSISYQEQDLQTSGKILLLLDRKNFDSVLSLGDEYVFIVKIRKITPALNPHQFDYKKFLHQHQIERTATIKEIISQKHHSSILYKIKNYNQYISQKVDRSSLSPDSKEFLKAFLLGDRSDMKKDNIDAYSKAGIMHLIAISGMHIAFIFGIIFWIFHLILGYRRRKTIIICSLIFVWIFGYFVDLSSSVFRACLMITLYYIFELLKRPSNIYHSLSLSAIIILLYTPNEIYSIGFQLSYTAVFFIVWLSPSFSKWMNTKNRKINKWIVPPLAMTFSAQLGTLPLVIFYFHQFSLLSIFINILLIPYSAIITYASIAEIFIIFLPESFQTYSNFIYDVLIEILIDSTHRVSSAGKFLFQFISLNIAELICLISSIILLKYLLLKPNMKNAFSLLLCLLGFQLCRFYHDYYHSQKKELIVFQQYKSPLIGLRNGKEMIILKDSKDNINKINQFIVTPYITGERIENVVYKNIDYREVYVWNHKKIQIVNKKFSHVINSIDYLITSGNSAISSISSSPKKIIICGYIYPSYTKKLTLFNKANSNQIWKLQQQGAFISSLP